MTNTVKAKLSLSLAALFLSSTGLAGPLTSEGARDRANLLEQARQNLSGESKVSSGATIFGNGGLY